MAFQQGLSGLNTASKALDVISNNVANSGTVGFKAGQALFGDVYASAIGGAASSLQVGIGASIGAVRQGFNQGNITATNNPLDMAINGNGFFSLTRSDGSILYSRNGQFDVDENGYVVTSYGDKLMGFAVTSTVGGVTTFSNTSAVLQIPTGNIPPRATQDMGGQNGVVLSLNLDARTAVQTFDITDATTYSSTSLSVYDSLGNDHLLSMYFSKTAAGAWEVRTQMDGGAVSGANALTFDVNGVVASGDTIAFTDAPAGAAPLAFTIDLGKATQYGSTYSVNSINQTGYETGQLSGLNLSKEGVIQGRYSNGQSQDLGRVTLATFASPNGLLSVGNNLWAPSPSSGPPIEGAPGAGTRGLITSGAVEDSNVDLTAELVNMITQQRTYQANAQSIKTQDQIMQTLVNLR